MTQAKLWRISWRHLWLFVAIFVVEVLIALFVRDQFIRPFFGDFLVVVLIFYFCKAFVDLPNRALGAGVLVFAFAIEFGQYFRMVEVLGLAHVKLARIVLGTTFSWLDLVAYGLGVLCVVMVEERLERGGER